MNFKVIIPSYSRASIICEKTLRVLANATVPQENIYVFVLQSQECSYKTQIKNYNFDKINLISVNIDPGLDKMRNYITLYFPEGEYLLHMDDDIDDILKLSIDTNIVDSKKAGRYKLISKISEFIEIYNDAFNIIKNNNTALFGIYPVANGYFMKDLPEYTFDLRFCVGALWGSINDHSIIIDIEEKEDVQRSIMYFMKYKKILRINNITIKTKYYKTKGGMQDRCIDDINRIESSKKSCTFLLEKYPEYTKLYTSKKSGIYEIKLMTSGRKLSSAGI